MSAIYMAASYKCPGEFNRSLLLERGCKKYPHEAIFYSIKKTQNRLILNHALSSAEKMFNASVKPNLLYNILLPLSFIRIFERFNRVS